MARQQEYSRKDADIVPAPIMRHSSFIAGIASDASVDMDMSVEGVLHVPHYTPRFRIRFPFSTACYTCWLLLQNTPNLYHMQLFCYRIHLKCHILVEDGQLRSKKKDEASVQLADAQIMFKVGHQSHFLSTVFNFLHSIIITYIVVETRFIVVLCRWSLWISFLVSILFADILYFLYYTILYGIIYYILLCNSI